MPANADLPPPLHHVFVDFENVHEIDLSVIGAKAVDFKGFGWALVIAFGRT